MKIVSYNVNGIRSALGKGLAEWLKEESPDVVCLQETKAQPEQIPTEPFRELGYYCYFFSAQKKGYSGVAILSRIQPDHVEYGIGNPLYDNEGRVIRADFGAVSVMSVYHPAGVSGDERQAFKMQWLEDFLRYTTELRKTHPRLIICGDFNICHHPIDIHDPVRNATSSGFLPEERQWLTRFIESGFIDTFRHFNKESEQYTWWSFRFNARKNNKGWRLDYCMASEPAAEMLKNAWILPHVVHSDHCPVALEIETRD